MTLSHIYMPSITHVLEVEEEPQWFNPEPESSVLIPMDIPPIKPNQRPPSYLLKPANMNDEELEGDEHFSFVVHFPQGTKPIEQKYDVVGRSLKEKRPRTSRGGHRLQRSSLSSNGKLKHNISVLFDALRRLYPGRSALLSSTPPTTKTAQHQH